LGTKGQRATSGPPKPLGQEVRSSGLLLHTLVNQLKKVLLQNSAVPRPLLGGPKLARRPHVALPCSRGSYSRFNFFIRCHLITAAMRITLHHLPVMTTRSALRIICLSKAIHCSGSRIVTGVNTILICLYSRNYRNFCHVLSPSSLSLPQLAICKSYSVPTAGNKATSTSTAQTFLH
jgi:hypothetical protein